MIVALASTGGILHRVTVTLSRGRRVVARIRIATLGRHRRQLTLRARHVLRRGTYRVIARAGRTVVSRRLRVR